MKGMELAFRYYEDFGKAMLEEKFVAFKDKIAVGLVGEGSQCFGFDDEISKDHDFGAGFCLWLTKEDYQQIGTELKKAYEALPLEFCGFKKQGESEFGGQRLGVFEIGEFYKGFLGRDSLPESLEDWRKIPEANLATITNGKVFVDKLGEFTAFRKGLLNFYPRDIIFKKMAARCMLMGQSGQYNYMRSVVRKEWVAAQMALAQFTEEAISMLYLLNKRYRPFYKWMHRGLKDLPRGGQRAYELFRDLAKLTAKPNIYERNYELIEQICGLIIGILKEIGFSGVESNFILDYAPLIQSYVNDEKIRALPLAVE